MIEAKQTYPFLNKGPYTQTPPELQQVGILYYQTLIHMKDAEASIFAFNETHGDDMNALNSSILTKSKGQDIQS